MTFTDDPAIDQTTVQSFASTFATICDNIELVVRGKRALIEQAVLACIAGGHILIEDVPGVGKTTLAKALAVSVGASMGRIQFTPDLLPSDVTGVNIWNRNTAAFEFRPGPIFSEFVLADEINRASPKTQSALLEAMAERQVTVDGVTHRLPEQFMVVATQNPAEQEGTYPLPESQLDRFLMRLSVGYPSRQDEFAILRAHEQEGLVDRLQPVLSLAQLSSMSKVVGAVHIADELRAYLIDFATASRQHPAIALGMSPRATLSLQRVARARAAANGRHFVIDDDIKAVAPQVIAHRLLLTNQARLRGGVSTDSVVDDLLGSVPIPRMHHG